MRRPVSQHARFNLPSLVLDASGFALELGVPRPREGLVLDEGLQLRRGLRHDAEGLPAPLARHALRDERRDLSSTESGLQ